MSDGGSPSSPQQRRATILGGPRNGEIVDWIGHEMRMPVPRPPAVYFNVEPDVIPFETMRVDRYVARQDMDGRWFYVRERRAS